MYRGNTSKHGLTSRMFTFQAGGPSMKTFTNGQSFTTLLLSRTYYLMGYLNNRELHRPTWTDLLAKRWCVGGCPSQQCPVPVKSPFHACKFSNDSYRQSATSIISSHIICGVSYVPSLSCCLQYTDFRPRRQPTTRSRLRLHPQLSSGRGRAAGIARMA